LPSGPPSQLLPTARRSAIEGVSSLDLVRIPIRSLDSMRQRRSARGALSNARHGDV
jgi:hypothetical protein